VFEWDPRKARAKADKHGVTFDDAVTVFADPNTLDGQDLAHSAVEGARRTTRKIDFSDIPEASNGQLSAMRRVGRPPLGDAPRQLIAIRVDAGVLQQFRKEARRRRVGYQTLINEVLAKHARSSAA